MADQADGSSPSSTGLQSCRLECGDGFHREHWRFVCADCAHVGPYRYYKSYATEDADAHSCATENEHSRPARDPRERS